jgi:mRNA interferase MazF
MGQISVGDVVVIDFPFSDFKKSKSRPALVLARAEFNNFILCQITSRDYSSPSAIPLKIADFSQGKLPLNSYIRPDKLFTSDPSIIKTTAGHLAPGTLGEVLKRVRKLFT